MSGSILRADPRSYSRAAAFAAALAVLTTDGLRAQQDPPPGTVPVAGIELEGRQRVNEAAILRTIGIQPGQYVSLVDLNQALARVWAMGQFRDVEFYSIADSTQANAPITLRVVLDEQPIVRSINFEGLENVPPGAIRDSANLSAGYPYSPAGVNEAIALVRSMLARRGFRVRSVEAVTEPVPDVQNEVDLTFRVEEGQRVAIADVAFEGNEAFTDDELRGVMGTKSEGFFWFRDGRYDEDKLDIDLRGRVPDFYQSNGYLDAAVIRDSLVVDPDNGKARLVVQLEEGPQYVLEEFDVRGNRRFRTDLLRSYFEQQRGGLLRSLGIDLGSSTQRESGDAFDRIAFEIAAQQVEALYANSGYIYARVQTEVQRLPPEAEGGPARVTGIWNILEGEPAFINTVRIVGNTFTHEDVIRGQLVTLPGDLYSQDLLFASYQRISALGFFETPLPQPIIEPLETGDVDITFVVKERQTGSINFGTTLGGYSGIAGFLGYDQPNLFGQAKSGHVRLEFGQFSNNFEANYTDPAIMGTRYSGSVSVFSSRDRFFTFQEGRRRRTGAGLRFGVPFWLDRRDTRLTVGYSVSRTVYEEFEDETSSLFSLPPGVQSTMSLGLTRSNIDHPTFPTRGTRYQLEANFNGGFLGGDGTFQKYLFSGAWYVPVGTLGGGQPGSPGVRTTLGLTAEGGVVRGDASRFPFERFWMGGVQFGRSLRGYEETTITPSGYIPRNANVPLEARFGNAYLRLSAEYAIRLSDMISLGAFYDAGNVWRDASEVNPSRLARGAGVGITLVTPFGPIGLDYAYGFDKQPAGWQLHFKFGQGF